MKTSALREEFRERLVRLASGCSVRVEFQLIDGLNYIYAVRNRTK